MHKITFVLSVLNIMATYWKASLTTELKIFGNDSKHFFPLHLFICFLFQFFSFFLSFHYYQLIYLFSVFFVFVFFLHLKIFSTPCMIFIKVQDSIFHKIFTPIPLYFSSTYNIDQLQFTNYPHSCLYCFDHTYICLSGLILLTLTTFNITREYPGLS